ncbi:flagellar assembly protein FliH [Gammaproteobacteria bacterium]|nr:flagellar assembly protein FliH [Gammaproteobacteria bacterium]
MTLSNEPEFSPWIIQPSTEEKIFKENIFDYGLSEEVLSKEEGLLPDEKNLDEDPTLLPGVESVENQIDEVELSETADEESVSEPVEDLYIEPEKVLQYSTEEYIKYGEAEFLKGYNSCLENENRDFSDKREHLDKLIETLKSESVDLESFYEPLKELLVKSIQEITLTDMKESKRSVENILATLLAEIELDKEQSVKVFLNPSDLVFLKDGSSHQDSELQFRADARLSRGSIRAVMGDSIIESIKENRVAEVVEKIIGASGKQPNQKKGSKVKAVKRVEKN